MRSQFSVLVLVLALLSGCYTTKEQFAKEETSAAEHTKGWQGNWDTVTEEMGSTSPFTEEELHAGRHLTASALVVQGAYPLDETLGRVLIVVEGSGMLELSTGRFGLDAGSVAVIPPGKGTLFGKPNEPLRVLVVEATAPEPPNSPQVQPKVLSFDQVFPDDFLKNEEPVRAVLLAALPGQLSLHAISVRGAVKRHIHQEHDEFVFLIDGWGTFGMGAEGSGRVFLSYPLRQKALVFIPFRAPHSYANESELTVALSVYGPDFDPRNPDRFFILGKEEQKKAGQTGERGK